MWQICTVKWLSEESLNSGSLILRLKHGFVSDGIYAGGGSCASSTFMILSFRVQYHANIGDLGGESNYSGE